MVPTITLYCDKQIFDKVLVGSVKFARRDAKRKAVLAVVEEPTEPLGDTRKTQKQRMWLMEKIADNLMFSSLDEAKRLTAVDQMYIEHIDTGRDLIVQGDEDARTFYVVENG